MLSLPTSMTVDRVVSMQEIAGRNSTYELVAVVLIGLLALYLVIKTVYWCYQGWLLTKYPGYIVPAKSKFAEHACKVIAGLFTSSMIGPVKVVGAEHARYGGRLLILPNHTHHLDFAVCERALPISYRQVGTKSEVSGIRAPIGAWANFIAIDTTGGKAASKSIAERTVKSYARALTFRSRGRLLVFPQGALVHSGRIPSDSKITGSMRTGAIRGAKLAQQVIDAIKSGDAAALDLVRDVHGSQADVTIAYYKANPAALDEPLAILPINIRYGKEHADTDAITILSKRGGGARVVIGAPVLVSSLSDDPRVASEQLRVIIEALRPE